MVEGALEQYWARGRRRGGWFAVGGGTVRARTMSWSTAARTGSLRDAISEMRRSFL